MRQSSTRQVLPFDRFLIHKELHRILASSAFQGSRRCQDFLSFVVNRALEGEAGHIKERIIAVEVFGRHVNSDLDHNSIVRVGAREVRKRLVQYYSGEGSNADMRIELPIGSYLPNFHEGPATTPAAPLAVSARTSHIGRHRLTWAVSVLIALALTAIVFAGRLRWQPAAQLFDLFWRPLLAQKGPALIVMAHPIVYRPALSDIDRNGTPLQHTVGTLPGSSHERDFLPIKDKYVGFGDSAAAFDLGALMGKQGHSAHIRIASKLQFADLCDSGAVLIGAYTNRWTMELMKGVRYRFGLAGLNPAVIDSTSGHVWSLGEKAGDESSTQDYMIISRVLQNSTGQFVVTAAGLTQYGTGETGRILTSPDILTSILTKLPDGWKTRNLQLVLHSEIVGDFPARPTLVAWWIG